MRACGPAIDESHREVEEEAQPQAAQGRPQKMRIGTNRRTGEWEPRRQTGGVRPIFQLRDRRGGQKGRRDAAEKAGNERRHRQTPQ